MPFILLYHIITRRADFKETCKLLKWRNIIWLICNQTDWSSGKLLINQKIQFTVDWGCGTSNKICRGSPPEADSPSNVSLIDFLLVSLSLSLQAVVLVYHNKSHPLPPVAENTLLPSGSCKHWVSACQRSCVFRHPFQPQLNTDRQYRVVALVWGYIHTPKCMLSITTFGSNSKECLAVAVKGLSSLVVIKHIRDG